MITPSTTRNTASPKSLNPRIAQVSAGNDAACTALRTAASKAAASPCITALASHTKRSEEHTSELQSHLNLVCRLLLEKKKRIPLHPSAPLHPSRCPP